MLKLNLNLKGLDKGEREVIDMSKLVLMKSMFKMEELAIKDAPFDKGELRQLITLFPEILASQYILRSLAGHSAAMEYGTRPFYAPIKPLADWAGRKLGDKSLGYAVQAKIAKYGITAQPYMRPALFQVENFWVDFYKKQVFK